MLKIGGKYSFEDNLSNRRSCLMFFDEDDPVSWSVDIGFSVEECADREDTFYIYEFEPMVSYEVEVLEIKDSMAHVRCSGIMIVDGYSDPYVQETFEIDSWIPVIESIDDWAKFENC